MADLERLEAELASALVMAERESLAFTEASLLAEAEAEDVWNKYIHKVKGIKAEIKALREQNNG